MDYIVCYYVFFGCYCHEIMTLSDSNWLAEVPFLYFGLNLFYFENIPDCLV